jgi:hypothetical protein
LRIILSDFSHLVGKFIRHTLISIQNKYPTIFWTGVFKRPIPLFSEPFKLVLKKPDSSFLTNLRGPVGAE